MEWDQLWTWIGNEIAAFGLRWGVVAILVLVSGGFLGVRYRKMNRRMKKLEMKVSEIQSTTVIHNNVNVANNPPDMGDVNEIRTMTQAEYDALPIKKEKTLYFITAENSR